MVVNGCSLDDNKMILLRFSFEINGFLNAVQFNRNIGHKYRPSVETSVI